MRYQYITDRDHALEIIQQHNRVSKSVVLDLETTGLNEFQDTIIDIQISGFNDDYVYIYPGSFADLLLALSVPVIGHYLKFDIKMLYRQGVDVSHWKYQDTLLLGHLANENRESNSLDSYVKELWQDNYKEEFWKKYDLYQAAPQAEAHVYAAKDIYYTRKLHTHLLANLEQENIPLSLQTHVHQLQYSLLSTELKGLQVDLPYLTEMGTKLKSKVELLKTEMRSMVADYIDLVELEMWEKEINKRVKPDARRKVRRPEFSFDSSKQLATLLYNQLGLPPQKNDKTRNISVDDAALERNRQLHPLVARLQEYRGRNKIFTAFIEGTLDRIQHERIYPEFKVNGTVTGRISHSNPNLGQLPKAGGVRGLYVPDPDCTLLSADYSQLEVCLEANLTGDSNLAKIFQENLSKHDLTAQNLGIDRDSAKTLNFALQYWASHFKVAKLLKVPEKEAQKIWHEYWRVYKGPKALKAKTDRLVDQGLPIVNAFGRKRRFKEGSRNPWDSDYRQAYNFLIQSTGADITSRAFYLVSNWLKETGYGRGWFTVHDEILIECKKEHAEECEKALLDTMVSIGDEIGLKIPLKAESSGPMPRWED